MITAFMAIAGNIPTALGFYILGVLSVRALSGSKKWHRVRIPVPVIYLRAVAVKSHQESRDRSRFQCEETLFALC